jgi:glucose-1-phosphate thymidylyltransferase
MRPHTHTKPKPLIEFAGKSCLSHILDELKIFDEQQKLRLKNHEKASPITGIVFITGRLNEKIEDFVTKNYSFKSFFVEQKIRDGSAGAIRLAEPFIDEPALTIYVDTLFEADLNIINELRDDEGGIVWAKEVEDYQRFGVCVLDKNGYITKIVEKPKEPISKLANIGMYYVKDYKMMFEGIKYLYDNNISLKGEYYQVDALTYMMNHGVKMICPRVEGWYDTGKPETFLESHRAILEKHNHLAIKGENSVIIPPVHIADDVKIINSIVGPFVSISHKSEIINSIVRDSVIGRESKINGLTLEKSIIGDNVEISDNAKQLNIGDHSTLMLGEKKVE